MTLLQCTLILLNNFCRLEKNDSGSWRVHNNAASTSTYEETPVAFNDESLLDQPSGSRLLSAYDASDDSVSSQFDDSDADKDYFLLSSESTSDSSSTSAEEVDNQAEMEKENEVEKKIISRKRRANPSQWKRNKRKFLRNCGQEYKSKKNNIVSARHLRSPCGETCRLKCSSKFTENERLKIFEKFWDLGDINKQRFFIMNSIEILTPRYRYPVLKEGTNRQNNHSFFLEKDNVKMRVCKTFFMATLDISIRCIRTVLSKSKDGFIENDRRGKHLNHLTVPEDIKAGVRSHISSIPVMESHYTRANSSKSYIEGGKTLAQLHRDYRSECEAQNRTPAKFSTYREIFNYEFNLEFFKPKKDLCETCEAYKNLIGDEKMKLELKYQTHLEEKELSRIEKDNDKKCIDKLHIVACFDLQAALPTPKGEISTFYYKSKLSTYNFTVCSLQTKGLDEVHSYLWHEGEGKKGATEIGSCLLKYLEEAAASTDDENLEITFYSDNCGGQGKNKYIIIAYLYAVTHFKIKSICHKFLVVGHTQNEGDCCHSLIEKNIKLALRAGPIYVPTQFAAIIKTAKKTGKPIKVHELAHDFFLDIKKLTDETSVNFNIDKDGKKFNFNDICVIKVEKTNPYEFLFKTSYKQAHFNSVNINEKKTRKSLKPVQTVKLQKAYQEPQNISKKKFDDLQSMVHAGTIPTCHRQFFNGLNYE